jgi:hypothetical protein
MTDIVYVPDLTIREQDGQRFCGHCGETVQSSVVNSREVGIDDSSVDVRDWRPLVATVVTLLPCGHSIESVHHD